MSILDILALAATVAGSAYVGFDVAYRVTLWRTRHLVLEEIEANELRKQGVDGEDARRSLRLIRMDRLQRPTASLLRGKQDGAR